MIDTELNHSVLWQIFHLGLAWFTSLHASYNSKLFSTKHTLHCNCLLVTEALKDSFSSKKKSLSERLSAYVYVLHCFRLTISCELVGWLCAGWLGADWLGAGWVRILCQSPMFCWFLGPVLKHLRKGSGDGGIRNISMGIRGRDGWWLKSFDACIQYLEVSMSVCK